MAALLIKNGIVVTASDEYEADVYIVNDKIEAIGKNLNVTADRSIDAAGMYVMPGGVDEHTHFYSKFGNEVARGWETSKAAAAGGTTTVVDFCYQKQGYSLADSLSDYRKNSIEGRACCDYALHAVITDATEEVINEIEKLPEQGVSTCKLFMAYKGHPEYCDDSVILKALKKSINTGVTIMTHCENADMIEILQEECLKNGITQPYGHAISRPVITEAEATERAISLAKLAGAPLFVVHVTTRAAADAIRNAYYEGYRVFGETCTHYLTLTMDHLTEPDFEGAKYVCSPALRGQEDLDFLWEAVNKGYLLCISSDHCGYTFDGNKQQGRDDFTKIPNGIPGVQDRMSMVWTQGVMNRKISRQKFVELCCTNPARINGIYPQKGTIAVGSDADIVIFNPDYKGVFTNDDSLQGLDFNPYEGLEKKGRPETVILRGRVVVENGRYIGEDGMGAFVVSKPYGYCYL